MLANTYSIQLVRMHRSISLEFHHCCHSVDGVEDVTSKVLREYPVLYTDESVKRRRLLHPQQPPRLPTAQPASQEPVEPLSGSTTPGPVDDDMGMGWDSLPAPEEIQSGSEVGEHELFDYGSNEHANYSMQSVDISRDSAAYFSRQVAGESQWACLVEECAEDVMHEPGVER